MDETTYPESSGPVASATQSFWIQGRLGPHWRNLENLSDSQSAIQRLGELVAADSHDELKLLEARVSPITGRCEFRQILAIRDRKVLDHGDGAGPTDADLSRQAASAGDLPQMTLWEEEAETPQHELFPTEPMRSRATPPGADAPPTGSPAESQAEFQTEPQTEALATALRPFADERRRETERPGRRLRPAAMDRSARGSTPRRVALLSGVLAGAFAAGLALASLDPQGSARLYASLTGDLPLLPNQHELATLLDSDNLGRLRQALLRGANPNQRTADGTPVLLLAANSGAPAAVSLLLQAGADPTATLSDGYSVLHRVAADGNAEALRLMLRAGAEPNLAGGDRGCLTPLGVAVKKARLLATDVLTDYGARLTPLPGCEIGPVDLAAGNPLLRERLAAAAEHSAPDAPPLAAAPATPETRPDGESRIAALSAPAAPAPPRQDSMSPASEKAQPTGSAYPRPPPLPDTLTAQAFQMQLAVAVEAVDVSAIAAVLSRRPEDAAPDPALLHLLAESGRGEDALQGMRILLEHGVAADTLHEGLTPLMRAARRGDAALANLLMAFGADPARTADSGRMAADFAAESGNATLHEWLVVGARGPDYEKVMFGLSWYDTLETARDRIDVCKDVPGGFIACKLKAEPWLADVGSVVAQFDRQAGDRLVALQLDSRLFGNDLEARRRFDEVIAEIEGRLPPRQHGFPVREIARGMPFFESLRPAVNAGEYFHYWPDESRTWPAYVHLKLVGHKPREGFYRIVIGNPFRVG